ncbi:J domain-containing protein [Hydrogenophaga sp. MI9]|uniref:J domain-containing protein n=1 Tax=Hydrogenophaga sp. MI9 TaxID=3453719 RepID=UPI003EEA7FA0
MASTPAASWGDALVSTLLDFERTPGRYPQALREPRLLYDGAHAVLQLAVGRTVEGLSTLGERQEAAARRAARFFVRTALLRPDNDHYTLLGLGRKADAEQVRDHYRLMIRLTHPDFEAGGEHWPADAASRINIAHDVLASSVRRAGYDATLPAGTAAMPKPAPVPAAAGAPRPRVGPVHLRKGLPGTPISDRWRHLMSTRAKVFAALVGALVCGAVLLVLDTPEEGSLAARQRTVSEDTASYVDAGPRLPAPPETVVAASPAIQDKALTATPATAATAARTAAPARPAPATPPPGELRLTMDTRLAMAPAPGPAPVAGDAAATAPAVSAAPVPAPTPPVAAAAEPAAAEPSARLTMAQVHPALTNVVGSLYSGRGESLAQWIDRDWRALPANSAFVTQFNQWLAGHRVTQLGKVSFKSRNMGEQLVVDGVVEVHLQDGSNAVQVRDLQLRAYFQPQDGRPVLTQLVASQTR